MLRDFKILMNPLKNGDLRHLHWMFMESRKTWKRYATTNPVFIWMVMKEYFKKKWK